MARKKPGRPKVEKTEKKDSTFEIVRAASEDLEEAVDSYEGDDDDDFGYIMEKVLHASGLLKGMVLIMEERKSKQ